MVFLNVIFGQSRFFGGEIEILHEDGQIPIYN